MWVGPTDDQEYERIVAGGGRPAEIVRRLREIAAENAGEIRRRYPDIPRRVSGYNLDQLLPGGPFDLARALVGSEGTLVTVLRAELALVPVPAARSLVVLGYHDIAAAGDAVPPITAHRPLQLEGLDDKLVGYEARKHMNEKAVAELPEGGAWLMVSFTGDSQEDADQRARTLVEELGRGELRRPQVRARTVGAARVRARRHRARPRHDRHLARLGGLGRRPGPARRLPARPAQPAGRVRLRRRRPVRALRPGVRAHPHPV